MPSLASLRVLVPFVVVTAACGASGTSSNESPEPAADARPAQPTPSSSPTTTAPTATPDASTGPTSRAKCGAAAYDWVTSATLGDVLESKNLAPHTVLDLNYALIEARKTGFKTRRLAKYGTKSRIIRYQTQDRGQLIDATATIAYPDTDNKTFPVLAVLHGTAGFSDQCSPSGGIADDLLGSFQDGTAILLSLFASLGYIVVAPDYIGLKSMGSPTGFLHPYLVAEPTAIASLDSIRAAKKAVNGSGITPGDVLVVGGSQGGHAAAFVNRYAPHYAPELVIKGSVWDVPPTDLIGQVAPALTTDQKATKNVVAATTTLSSWYKSSPNGLAGAFAAPFDTQVPQAMAATCSPNESLKNASLDTVFTPEFRTKGQQPNFADYQPWACYMMENSLPSTSVPKLNDIPSLFLLAGADDLVNNTVERASFQKLCTQGHTLQFLECADAGHTKPLSWAFDQWVDFLEDRLDGKPVQGACAIKPAERCTSQP